MFRSSPVKINGIRLAVACLGVVAMYVTFASNNVNRVWKPSHTRIAIERAALQVAHDAGRIVVEGSSGQVALLDDDPPRDSRDNRLVSGINTLLATARLDAVIADALGNGNIALCVERDSQRAQSDARLLAAEINRAVAGELVKDKEGRPIDLIGNANDVYQSSLGSLSPFGGKADHLHIEVAQLETSYAETTVPMPDGTTGVNASTAS